MQRRYIFAQEGQSKKRRLGQYGSVRRVVGGRAVQFQPGGQPLIPKLQGLLRSCYLKDKSWIVSLSLSADWSARYVVFFPVFLVYRYIYIYINSVYIHIYGQHILPYKICFATFFAVWPTEEKHYTTSVSKFRPVSTLRLCLTLAAL